MGWIINLLTSSIGKKLLMSLTGLFLIIFLVTHLIGNFQLFVNDGGEAFNLYTQFMSTNPLVQFIAKGLYFFIILHVVLGLMLWFKNRMARGAERYAVNTSTNTSFAARNMALLGTLILAFLMLHMGDFWFKIKFDADSFKMLTYEGTVHPVKDVYSKVEASFKTPWIAISYLIGLIVLALHLWHGFQSAFQTLGLNHKKYTPIIQLLGKAYAILIPLGFAVILAYMFFK